MDGDPRTYHTYAEEAYERPVDYGAIVSLYNHHPLTDALLAALNPALSLAEVRGDQEEIGYPG